MDLDAAPTLCRYDGCTLGPDGGPAPLVQPIRGGNLREYCSDRHRIAAHRSRQRRPRAEATASDRPDARPSQTAGRLATLAEELTRLSGEVGRALALGDADRMARELEDARLRAREAEARAEAVAAERDREQASAAAFREMAESSMTSCERATGRAEDAKAARDAALEAARRAETERDQALQMAERAQAHRREAEQVAREAARRADRERVRAEEAIAARADLVAALRSPAKRSAGKRAPAPTARTKRASISS